MRIEQLCKILTVLFTIVMGTMSCSSNGESESPRLTVSKTEVSFEPKGGTLEITISTNASWNITNPATWLQISQPTGNAGDEVISLTVATNGTGVTRSVTLDLTSDNGQAKRITVSQGADLYPSYNLTPLAPDATGMGSTAVELAAKINLGWNLGNTLEAMGGETAWGNPMASKELIDFVKASGFNAVRIPCSWNQNSNPSTAKINQEWLNRVKEVVQYCIDNDLYVLLNIHWDGGWLDENINAEKQEGTKAKQKAFWEQIATQMRDFDEHLMFAGSNEPPVDDAEGMEVLLSYHQTFVDAVRSTGGRNSYRTLVVQGPTTDIEKTKNLMDTLPTDEVEDRLMVEVHYYEPWQFAGLTSDVDWGNRYYYWGEGNHSETDTDRNAAPWGEENLVDERFLSMKTKFVDNGIPVILGEYGAIRRTAYLEGDALTLHLASRAHYIKYVTQRAIANGLLPFYWDEGSLVNHGFGFIDRSNNTVGDQQVLDALLEGAEN